MHFSRFSRRLCLDLRAHAQPLRILHQVSRLNLVILPRTKSLTLGCDSFKTSCNSACEYCDATLMIFACSSVRNLYDANLPGAISRSSKTLPWEMRLMKRGFSLCFGGRRNIPDDI